MINRDNRRKRGGLVVFQKNSSFRGVLNFKEPLLIEGQFEGEISGEDYLEIGQSAQVKAHIVGSHIAVYGLVEGNIYAKDKVELKSGATVIGKIRTPNFEVEDGVVFEGSCEMKEQSQAAS